MSGMLKDLLLNLFFISFLPLLIVSTWGERYVHLKNKTKIWIINLTASLATILCMSSPVQVGEGFIFDLRQIPVIIVSLYLGYKNSLILLFFTLFYRFLIGGEGFYVYLIIHLTIFALVPLLKNTYKKANLIKKLMINSFLSIFFASYAILLSKLFSPIPIKFGEFAVYYIVLQALGMVLLTLILQYINENSRLKMEMMRSEKLKALGELSASVSHELKNPLTVTKGFIQLINEYELPAQEKQKYLSLALNELNRAREIIDAYLVFANPYPTNIVSLNIQEEITKAIGHLRENHAGITFQYDSDPELVFKGESNKLQLVLNNLLKNAIEAMPEGGIILIEAKKKKDSLHILIQDNGCGMSNEEINRLGEPIFELNGKGTGLGLMVVYRIIHSLGGTIEVSSKLNEGTDVSIMLPIDNNHTQ